MNKLIRMGWVSEWVSDWAPSDYLVKAHEWCHPWAENDHLWACNCSVRGFAIFSS